ncbi:MAG: hypothetical protein CL608_17265 [Anaerolineaceae bacterium]|nr:hypothetical protein [Anaerolineaceae bacterium]
MKKYSVLSLLTLVVVALFIFVTFQSPNASANLDEAAFDYAQASDNHAARWQAMAQFYADNDMLNDRFDYKQASDVHAARWQAMAQFYADNDMLNEPFDYEQAADVHAARWQAMARYYVQHDLVNMPSQ